MSKHVVRMSVAAAILLMFAAFPVHAFAQTDVNVVQSVDEPALHPYQTNVSLDFGLAPGTEGSTFKTVFLPPGKRLVIQYVSAGILLSGTKPDNFIARASIATTFDGKTVTHLFVPTLRGSDVDSGFRGYAIGEMTRLYTDNKFVVTVIPNSLPNGGVAGVSISGYLVDIDANRAPGQ